LKARFKIVAKEQGPLVAIKMFGGLIAKPFQKKIPDRMSGIF
jgi:hypothetical protein